MVERAIVKHNRLLRRQLLLHKGYESREHNGSFLLAFRSPEAAIKWALSVQVMQALAHCNRSGAHSVLGKVHLRHDFRSLNKLFINFNC